MKPILCFNKQTKTNFLVISENEQVRCAYCKNILELGSTITVHHCYSKILPLSKTYYCGEECVKNINYREQSEIRIAKLTSIIPENVVFISDHPTEMKDSKNMSVFQAAQLESETTTDHTQLSGGPSIGGARIGADYNKEIEEDKSKGLDEKEFDKEIEDLRGK